MPEPEPTPTPTPTPTPDPKPEPTPNPKPEPTPEPTPEPRKSRQPVDPDPKPDFTIPDEYADRSWAKKISSQEDLYKQIDSMDKLIGKKEIPFDYANATPQQIEDHHAKTRPENKDAYDFFPEDFPKEVSDKIKDIFWNRGISAHNAKAIYDDYSKMQEAETAKQFSTDGFKEVMKTSFPEDTDKKAGETANFLKKNMVEADHKMLDETFNNEQLGVVYRLVNNLMEQYGAKETDKGLIKPDGKGTYSNVNEMRADIRQKIVDLKKRPHRQSEVDDLNKQLRDTYK